MFSPLQTRASVNFFDAQVCISVVINIPVVEAVRAAQLCQFYPPHYHQRVAMMTEEWLQTLVRVQEALSQEEEEALVPQAF